MERISRRKMWLTGSSCVGKRPARRFPRPRRRPCPTKIQKVSDSRFNVSPPFQLLPQHVEEHLARRTDQVQRVLRAVAHQRVALADGRAHLAVDGQIHALIGTARDHADHAGFGHQHRPVGEHVRADGREADGRHGGKMMGPPAESEYAVEPVGVEMIRPSAL